MRKRRPLSQCASINFYANEGGSVRPAVVEMTNVIFTLMPRGKEATDSTLLAFIFDSLAAGCVLTVVLYGLMRLVAPKFGLPI